MTAHSNRLRASSMAVLAGGYLVSLVAFPKLPGPFLGDVPAARWLMALTLPTTALVIDRLFRSLWTHDRIRSGNGAFAATYDAIVLRVLLFVLALHVLVTLEVTGALTTIGARAPAGRLVVVLLGLVFVAIGNLLPRTRPNVAVGVRTTRTLTNERLWAVVHRVGGYVTVGLGLVIGIAGLALTHELLGGVVGAAAGLAAAIVLVWYRKYADA
jgi:hypothetical protein